MVFLAKRGSEELFFPSRLAKKGGYFWKITYFGCSNSVISRNASFATYRQTVKITYVPGGLCIPLFKMSKLTVLPVFSSSLSGFGTLNSDFPAQNPPEKTYFLYNLTKSGNFVEKHGKQCFHQLLAL